MQPKDFPVFPCSPRDKAPLTPGGFKAATHDPKMVGAWWSEHPEALIGMPTGTPSGLAVLDIDPRHGGLDWLAEHEELVANTYAYRTRSGGTHYVFRHVPGLRCSAGTLAPGVDVRAEGGYVVRWDEHGGDILCDAPPAAWPNKLLADLIKAQPSGTSEGGSDPARRAPPSADAVVALLNRMPNPLAVGRDDYIRVMLAARGCIVALGNDPDAADRIATAAVEWAERWEGWRGDDERAKWDADFGLQAGDLAGWATIERIAANLIPGYAEERVAARQADAAADFQAIQPGDDPWGTDDAPEPAAPVSALLWPDQVEALPDPEWLIDGILPARSLSFVFGPAKSGKSFMVLSMALCIAAGKPWFGRETKPGLVVYVAGEGAGGLKRRMKAARVEYDTLGRVPMLTLPRAVVLSDQAGVRAAAQDWQRTARAEGLPVALVIVDTLARSAPGTDENSAGEMGRIVQACDWIKDELQCVVMPVHHTGKDGAKGMRGSTALDGAADCAIRVERTKENGFDYIEASSLYQKDAEEFAPLLFDLHPVAFAAGGGSLVLRPRAAAPEKPEKLTPKQQAVYELVRAMFADTRGAGTVAWEDAVAECRDDPRVSNSDQAKNRERQVERSLTVLVEQGKLHLDGKELTLMPAPKDADNRGLDELLG